MIGGRCQSLGEKEGRTFPRVSSMHLSQYRRPRKGLLRTSSRWNMLCYQELVPGFPFFETLVIGRRPLGRLRHRRGVIGELVRH